MGCTARSSAVGYVSCFVRRPETVMGGKEDKLSMSLLPRHHHITIIKKPDQTRTLSCSQEPSQDPDLKTSSFKINEC